jgi:glucose/arabinose dehydrogenase
MKNKTFGLCPTALLAGAFFSLAAAQSDPPLDQYRSRVLLRNLSNPTSIAFLPDGRAYVTLKNGTIRLVNPATGDTATAGMISTANVREDGLLSLVPDPSFASNRWVYALFSERSPGDTALVVARYTTDAATGALLLASRQTLLKVPVTLNASTAEHHTGTLAFGPEGNLYVALADNTQNIFSGTGAGYAPRDPARPLYDAQRSAANTNDLRGKILRIRPTAEGGYAIPAGNLKDSINLPAFNPRWKAGEDDLTKVRPEIFVMGLRHPFKITVDPATGWLYWAEPGPNANADAATQGPRGYEVVGMAKGPGNYGWPYCRGNPATIPKPAGVTTPYFCYTEYNYSGGGTAGPMYKPDSLRNTSPNNTGIINLPPARPAQVWYPYSGSNATGVNFPVFRVNTDGGNAAMIGPVYQYDGSGAKPAYRLPIAFDRHIFIVEWHRSLIFTGRLDSAGGIQNLRSFRSGRDTTLNGPIDVKIGPDGALYLLNWVGNTYNNNAGNGTLTRLEYTGVQVGLAGGAEPRKIGPAGALFMFGPAARFPMPAGAFAADFYAVSGRKLWTFRRADASAPAFIVLPPQVQGVVRVKVRAP